MRHVCRQLVALRQVHYVTPHERIRDLSLMNLHQRASEQADLAAAEKLSIERFAIGQSVPRVEDPMLLRGEGRYTDDVSLPGAE